MKGTFYYNAADKRYLNKRSKLTIVQDNVSMEIIENCSVVDPVVKVSIATQYMKSNYLYLEDLHRWYYIINVTLSNGFAYLSCHVDVLYSYRVEIGKMKCILSRSTNQWSMYQNDDRYNLKSYPATRVVYIDKTKGFDMSINDYVLGTIGNVNS